MPDHKSSVEISGYVTTCSDNSSNARLIGTGCNRTSTSILLDPLHYLQVISPNLYRLRTFARLFLTQGRVSLLEDSFSELSFYLPWMHW